MKNNKAKKVIGIILVGGLLFSTCAVALAGSPGGASANPNQQLQSGFMMESERGHGSGPGGPGLGGPQSGELASGALGSSGPKINNPGTGGPGSGEKMMQPDGNGLLAKLVEAGIITQGEADELIALNQKNRDAQKTEMEKIKTMTAEERQAYFESKKDAARIDQYDEAVNNSIITEEQVDQIKAYQDEQKAAQEKARYDQFVEAGILTDAEVDEIIAYQDAQANDRQAEMEKVKAMTDEEREAYFASKTTGEKIDPFTVLVDAGIITQAQADQMKALQPEKADNCPN